MTYSMKNMFIKVLSVLSLVLVFSPFANAAEEPEVMGVLFYADWCNSCKVLEPRIDQARVDSSLDSGSVLFVTLDLTDEVTIHQSQLLAESLGLGDVYTAHEGTTGFMLLVDADSKKVITRLTKELESEDISDLVGKAITHASS